MKRSRKLWAVMVSAMLLTTLVAGAAVASDGSKGDDEYKEKDGYQIEYGEVVLERGGMAPRSLTIEWRGTSYASTEEVLQLQYRGKSRAMANVWNNQRWIRASFKYSRGGSDIIPWQHSNATVNQWCAWSAGPEASRTIWDSPWPWDPPTIWNYSFLSANPNLC